MAEPPAATPEETAPSRRGFLGVALGGVGALAVGGAGGFGIARGTEAKASTAGRDDRRVLR